MSVGLLYLQILHIPCRRFFEKTALYFHYVVDTLRLHGRLGPHNGEMRHHSGRHRAGRTVHNGLWQTLDTSLALW
ncbi:MAG: hypothetical protein LBC14_07075 [Desulfovibrio sp.]|nr:hypothetical protein [Desulfovibrio sp.]